MMCKIINYFSISWIVILFLTLKNNNYLSWTGYEMITESRDILYSQKVMDSLKIGQMSQEINLLIKSKNYEQLAKKCSKMAYSKQRFLILAYSYLGLKQWKNLIESCDQGLEYDQRQPQFYSLKAKALGKLGKYHQKILLLKEALRLNSLEPSYHRNLGSAYYNIQKYDLAIQQYCKAIDLQPENVLNYHNKGSALLKNEKYQEAKLCFIEALQKNPNLALTCSWLADCEKKLGNYEEAEKLYKKAHKMSGKQIYLEELKNLDKQKQLNNHKNSWYSGLAWLGDKLF